MSLQKYKSLHFPTKTVEMPSTDALPYLMYKAMRGALADLKDSLDETLEREFNRISDKGMSLLPRITIKMILCLEILKSKYSICLSGFVVISLKETSNQNLSEKTKGKLLFFS